MKKIFFLLFLIPVIAPAQNFLFEITPQGDGTFRVLITDDTREAFPRSVTDYGVIDTATLQLLTYQRIDQAKSQQANNQARSFINRLNAEQTADSVGVVVPIDYQTWAASQYATSYDGTYAYQVRGTAINFNVTISGTQVRRVSNNNLIATLSANTANWITVTAGADIIDLYQVGVFWVGRNPAGQIVTLKRL